MGFQSQSNGRMAYKVQSGLGSRASGAGGLVFPQSAGAGGKFAKGTIADDRLRRDGMTSRGRHGMPTTSGAWTGPTVLGSFETILEAALRDTWSAADLAITQASTLGGSAAATSVTTTANTIVAAAGSWITQGLRVGDVVIPTGLPDAANNGKPIRLSGVTALTLTTPDTLVLNATPDTSFAITRKGKKLIQFSTGALVERYFTIDEHELDIDQSEITQDFMWGNLKFTMGGPNNLLMVDVGGMGTGAFEPLSTGSSPLLTSPTEFDADALAVIDATIRIGNQDVADLTSFDFTFDVPLSAPATFGVSTNRVSPKVFAGNATGALNLTMLRQDLQFITDFAAETQYSLHVLAQDEARAGFFAFALTNFTLGGVDKSALSNKGGGRTQTISVPKELIGKDASGGAFAATMVGFQSTGAP